MSRLTPEDQPPFSPRPDEWRREYAMRGWADSRGPSVGLLVAGLVAVGLGALAWSYIGPDLRRYLKIKSM